jgi:hypothetical protein
MYRALSFPLHKKNVNKYLKFVSRIISGVLDAFFQWIILVGTFLAYAYGGYGMN